MHVRPLRFAREISYQDSAGNVYTRPAYGRNCYYTADRTFSIWKDAWNDTHEWKVCVQHSHTNAPVAQTFRQSGLSNVTFHRLRDVIDALEHVYETHEEAQIAPGRYRMLIAVNNH